VPAGFDPDAEAVPFVVPLPCAGLRLDRFLAAQIRFLSRTRAQAIVRAAATNPAGRRLRPSHRVSAGELIWVFRRRRPEPVVPGPGIRVIHEDPDLVVLDKPAGFAAHPTSRYREATVTRFLQCRYPGQPPRIGHRIDRETSGVVLATRTLEADRALKRQFERREVEKLYLALVHGRPEPRDGLIDLPLGTATESRIWIKQEARPDGFAARTRYRTLVEAGPYALVAASPETGRQHQIRAHLAAIGCRLVGDKIYDPDETVFLRFLADPDAADDGLRSTLVLDRHALHAWTVALVHPTQRRPCRFIAPVPDDLAGLIERHAGPDWRDALPGFGRDGPADW
jgi:23S rRNA pseudouridine1911/1915/1917 synthase